MSQAASALATRAGAISHEDGAGSLVQPALARARCIFAQRSATLAARADTALATILRGVERSHWPEVAWEFSRLTERGFPVEFSFSTSDESIRYTAEVAGPELADTERLARAAQLMVLLGGTSVSVPLMAALGQLQQTGRLRYGAWIAGRHRPRGDRFKLYAEVPDSNTLDCTEWIPRLCSQHVSSLPWLAQGSLGRPRWLMCGHEPASGRMEFYFSVQHLEPWQVGRLMHGTAVASRAAELLGLLEEIYDGSLQRCLPRSKLGFSYSLIPGTDGASMVFSIFGLANSICADDMRIRRKVLTLAEHRGWDFGSYAQLSEPLASLRTPVTYHSMLSFSVAANGQPTLHVGLQPPELTVHANIEAHRSGA